MASELASAPTEMPKLKATHEGEYHGDYGSGGIVKITRATYIFVLCAAVNSTNLGYDIGVSTKASHLIQDDLDLSRIQREIFIGSLNFWAMFGAMFAQYFTDNYGRRRTFLMAAVGFIIGCVIMALSNSYGLLLFGRFFVGLGVGTGLAIDPLYIAEVTPARHRGALVTWSEIALNIGIVLGFCLSLFFKGLDDGIEWRVMFLMGTVLPLLMIFLVLFVMPESPRWLVANQRDTEAREVLLRIYPEGYDVGPLIADIKEALEREKTAEHAVGWKVIFFPTPALRRMLLVGVGMAVSQQAVGIDAIQYYLLDVLKQSGIDSETKETLILIFLGIIKLLFIFVGGKLFDTKGRKPLFLVSLAGMAVATLLISIAFFVNSDVTAAFIVIGLAFYLAFFSIGIGPGAWLIPSEVFSACIRAKAMSTATFLNRLTATLMSSTFLSVAKAIGWGGFFLLLCVICLIVIAFLHVYLPETKGRSLEEMSVYFAELTNDTFILEAEAQLRGNMPSIGLSSSADAGAGGHVEMGETREVL